jgi:HD-GYP domain-containing protein (c-di-GMP phosphodiesterase class II)
MSSNPHRDLVRDHAAASLEQRGSMVHSGYPGIVLDRLAKQAVEILAADQSCIFVRDHEDPTMTIIAAAQGPAEESLGKRVHATAERFQGSRGPGAAVELLWGGDVQGALSVADGSRARTFTPEELAVLRSLGDVVGAAVVHAHARTADAGHGVDPIRELAAVLDRRDGYTARHSEAVVSSACAIGRALSLERAALAELEVAALLHDIGKVGVPDSILNKPGPLTPEERAVMTRHPTWGADALSRIPGLEAVATIVRYHHERWDGAGYPHGLSGTRIPLASRIIAVCDAHNAMTSDRPYRDAMPVELAYAELRAGAGGQFDPSVVEQIEAIGREVVVA